MRTECKAVAGIPIYGRELVPISRGKSVQRHFTVAAALHGRGGTSFPADNLSPHGTEPACNSGQTGSIHRICGGSLPSFHPLSVGDVVVLSLSANRANGISLAAR